MRSIGHLYDDSVHGVKLNSNTGEWFSKRVGVRQGHLLSLTLHNIFLKRINSVAFEEHDKKVTIGGRTITNLRFANDIDALATEEQELMALGRRFNKICTRNQRRRFS